MGKVNSKNHKTNKKSTENQDEIIELAESTILIYTKDNDLASLQFAKYKFEKILNIKCYKINCIESIIYCCQVGNFKMFTYLLTCGYKQGIYDSGNFDKCIESAVVNDQIKILNFLFEMSPTKRSVAIGYQESFVQPMIKHNKINVLEWYKTNHPLYCETNLLLQLEFALSCANAETINWIFDNIKKKIFSLINFIEIIKTNNNITTNNFYEILRNKKIIDSTSHQGIDFYV